MTTPKRGRPSAIPDSERATLETLLRDHTTEEVATQLGVTSQTVRRACQRFSIPLRDKIDLQILKNTRAWRAAQEAGRQWQESVRPIPDSPRL